MLSNYLDDELHADERSRLETHLADCVECGYELSELEQTVALLRGLPEAAAPTGLADGVMARVRAGEAEPSRWGRAIQRFADPGTGLALAAGVAGLVVFAAFEPVRVPLPGSAGSEPQRVSPPPTQIVQRPQAESGVPVQTVSQGSGPARTAGFSQGLASRSRPTLGATRVPRLDAELKWLLFDPEAPEAKVMELRQVSARERVRLLRLLAAQAIETNEDLEAFYRIRSVRQPGALRMAHVFEREVEAMHQASMR